MLTLPDTIIALLEPFALLFQKRTWTKAQVLLVGAVLAPGQRTVTTALRVMGLSGDANFARFHHVLNRAVWSPLALSRVTLSLLLQHLDKGDAPLVFGMDETVERRRGKNIKAKGIYRDGVRSSGSHFVKASGLRWISLMWLAHIPFARRTWALPIITALAPSERYYKEIGRAPQRLTDRARQIIIQLRRWLPGRMLVIVADNSYAVLDLLHFCQRMSHPVTFITRLRLDAALFELPPVRRDGQRGRIRIKGPRTPSIQQTLENPQTQWLKVSVAWYDGTTRNLEITSQTALWHHSKHSSAHVRWVLIRDPLGEFRPQALVCTDIAVAPVQIIEWFVLRWQIEVTFQEVRAHLGVETQRQWSDQAIARTCPALFGLFSWVTLASHRLQTEQAITPRSAAWYTKPLPTFSDALAVVRQRLWTASQSFGESHIEPDIAKIPAQFLDRLLQSLAYAA